ncbi:MAG: RNA 2'-phosphotransferase [Nitrosarchaeum sp.]|nr:RNA 2'-phosphotransferase [Nitrosarchaeum sp.]
MNDIVKQSKFLSYILRHCPESVGLTLDINGWANVDELLQKANLNFESLCEVVDTNNKKRFTFNEDKTKIRAAQGHSIDINLNLKPTKPPDSLYHGTAKHNWLSINIQGLIKCSRQYVHLSADEATALKVGQRHGEPLILRINSQSMFIDNYQFYLSDNNVWLTDSVPRKFISL